MLAARLDWPQATFASKLTLSADSATVIRETDTGEETLEMPSPAVVTTDLRLNEPRYIALPGIIKARSKPLDRRGPLTAPVTKTKVVRYEPAPARPPGRKVGNVAELVSALKDRGVL
jgi:electron transfer flavoprotein beta subunit